MQMKLDEFNDYFYVLDTINSKYKCLDINDLEFKNKMSQLIEYVKKLSSNDEFNILCENGYKSYIKNQLEKNDISYINNYINYNLKVSNDYNACKKEVYKLYNFLCEIEYPNEIELLFNVLKNNDHFKNIVQIIYLNYKNKKGAIGNSQFDNFLGSVLELYCEIYNVEMIDYEVDTSSDRAYNDYLNKIKGIPTLNREQEIYLFNKYESGDTEARTKIIEGNLRLVPSIARKICKGRVDFLDIVEYGNVGLIEAVDRFDVSRGYHFSTFATWIIKQKIYEALHFNRNSIRLRGDIRTIISKYNKFLNEYYSINGNYPSLDVIVQKLNIPKSKIVLIQKYLNSAVSLNQVLFDDKGEELINNITDESVDIYEGIEHEDLKKLVTSLFSSAELTYNEAYVIIKRYGLVDNECETYRKLACELGYSYENIRRLEMSALKKMRNCPKIIDVVNYSLNPQKNMTSIKIAEEKNSNHRSVSKNGVINVSEEDDPFLMDEYINILKYIKKLDNQDLNKVFTEQEITFIYLQLDYLNGKKYSLNELSKILYIDGETIADNLANILVKFYNYINDGKNYTMVNDVLKVRLLLNRIRTWK